MFKKPFRVKSNTQLKGSDRKKLKSDILHQFPKLEEEQLNLIFPNKETIFLLKVLAHSGEVIVIYTVQKLPIIFEIEKLMYPTVYMLWHVPDLIHTFTTHPQVFPIITGGADLMLPGVICNNQGIHAYGKFEKGERAAVNLITNMAPIAVGKAANSSYDMYMSAKRGKCVHMLHYYGDLLSTYGTKLVIPELGPVFDNDKENSKVEGQIGGEKAINNSSSNQENIEPQKINDKEILLNQKSTESHLSTDSTSTTSTIEMLCLPLNETETYPSIENVTVPNTSSAISEGRNLSSDNSLKSPSDSTESMDELLKYCFLKSLRSTMKKVDLPLLTSNFYKLHMLPVCPEGKTLDVKKSSYKKLSNFLDFMVKLGAVKVEELQKGVQSITKIDYSCELVKQFVDALSNEECESGILIDTSRTTKTTVPEITEKHTVTAAVLPLFYPYDYKKKEAVSGVVVRKVIGDYVRTNNLQNPNNRKEVVLDDVLHSATNTTNQLEVLPWDQLVQKVVDQMGHSFKVELGGNELPMSKGKLPPIDIQVGTRSGNKKVTLINNLELYGINLQEFARECQIGVAASTTVNTVPSSKSAQLQIQGNQVIFVAKILTEKYQIPKRYLRGCENAPKKKK